MKYGVPTRKCGFVLWEADVQSFVGCGQHVLLVRQMSIEVQVAATGQLLHIIQGNEIWLVQNVSPGSGPMLFARQGQKDDAEGLSDELLELSETSPVVAPPMDSRILWEWD
jgi:RHO1 GDP-GTP exchange protein 1/2